MTSDSVAPAFRAAMRRLAASVVVLTCSYQGRRYGMSATAVDALSMDPPSMLACVNQSASMFLPLSQGVDFGINILAGGHEQISRVCSGQIRGEARFDTGNWEDSATGVPLLVDAQASLVCRHANSVLFGTHGIFVGLVVEARTRGEINPLIYLDGKYGGFLPVSD